MAGAGLNKFVLSSDPKEAFVPLDQKKFIIWGPNYWLSALEFLYFGLELLSVLKSIETFLAGLCC